MPKESPIKDSVQKRLAEERYVFPKEKRQRRRWFSIQWLLIISILIGLFFTVLRLLTYF